MLGRKPKRILLTGAGGTLGLRLLPALQERFPRAELYSVFHGSPGAGCEVFEKSALGDLSEPRFVSEIINACHPDLIINLAALTDVDACERDPELAQTMNVEIVRTLLDASPNSKFIQLSTDYVFSGNRGAYKPDDVANPKCVYGQTKLSAETLALERSGALVVRTSGIYDWLSERNLFAFFFKRLVNNEPVRALSDCVYSPVWSADLAQGICGLIEARAEGIAHYGGPEPITRAQFARTLAKACELPETLITDTPQKNFNWPAERPADSSLDSEESYKLAKRSPKTLELAFGEIQVEMLARPQMPQG